MCSLDSGSDGGSTRGSDARRMSDLSPASRGSTPGSDASPLAKLPHIPDAFVYNSFLEFFFLDDEIEQDSFTPSRLVRSASDGSLLSSSRAAVEVCYQFPLPALQKVTSTINKPTRMEEPHLSLGSQMHPLACKPCVFFPQQMCYKGGDCIFCHLTHRKSKQIRPSKKVRAMLKASLTSCA
eukprot:CAMPEP_0115067198 /NCGR_PEP_ID=MMETSP0227-20121206/11247_1 /TAXON_ID=89957 /ORGANISM="Polarella glacialis, Strain CCMP 1383" /LENGTH=180 /DNA_ID=CAMNT_0002453219 /DNA_START=40 /DNA_END=583 /DNA_ORIENTATION=-